MPSIGGTKKSSGFFLPLLLLALLLVGLFFPAIRSAGWDFRVNLWGPAYRLLHGQSPYATRELAWVEPIFKEVNAIWFPPAIGALFFMGGLDPFRASTLWFFFNLGLILVLLWWSREGSRFSPLLSVPALLLFPPLLTHLVLGQFSLAALLLVLAATSLLLRRREMAAGLLLALSLTKPQLLLLVGPGLWLLSWRSGGRRAALCLPAGVLGGALSFTLPLWIGYPNWVPDFWRALRDNPFWYQPTLYTNLRLCWGRAGWILPALLSLGLFALNLRLWWRYPAREVLPWSLALTTLVSPYIWTWDFVLLLPLMLRCLQRQRGRAARLIWALGLLLCLGLTVWIRLALLAAGDNRHHLYAWIPWWVLLLVLAGQAAEVRWAGGRWRSLLRPAWEE